MKGVNWRDQKRGAPEVRTRGRTPGSVPSHEGTVGSLSVNTPVGWSRPAGAGWGGGPKTIAFLGTRHKALVQTDDARRTQADPGTLWWGRFQGKRGVVFEPGVAAVRLSGRRGRWRLADASGEPFVPPVPIQGPPHGCAAHVPEGAERLGDGCSGTQEARLGQALFAGCRISIRGGGDRRPRCRSTGPLKPAGFIRLARPSGGVCERHFFGRRDHQRDQHRAAY